MKATQGLVLPHPWEIIHHQRPTLVPGKGSHWTNWKSKVPAAELPEQDLQHNPQPVVHGSPMTLEPWKKSARMNLGTAWIVLADCTACGPEPLRCTALNYPPQNSTTLLTVATQRSPPSDLS